MSVFPIFTITVPGLAEHADRWGNRINKYISMFEIVISRHKQRAAPSSNPSQVGAISQGPNVHLEDLTPPERAALEYLEPSAFDRFSLAQMCYISAVTSLEQNGLTLFPSLSRVSRCHPFRLSFSSQTKLLHSTSFAKLQRILIDVSNVCSIVLFCRSHLSFFSLFYLY